MDLFFSQIHLEYLVSGNCLFLVIHVCINVKKEIDKSYSIETLEIVIIWIHSMYG